MENITKTIERLSQFIDYKQLSVNKFSLKIGVSNSYFSKMIRNNASIGSDIIENILRVFPELNGHWLLTGTGEMIKKELFINKNDIVSEPQQNYSTACKSCADKDRIIQSQEKLIASLEKQIASYEKLCENPHECSKKDKKAG